MNIHKADASIGSCFIIVDYCRLEKYLTRYESINWIERSSLDFSKRDELIVRRVFAVPRVPVHQS